LKFIFRFGIYSKVSLVGSSDSFNLIKISLIESKRFDFFGSSCVILAAFKDVLLFVQLFPEWEMDD